MRVTGSTGTGAYDGSFHPPIYLLNTRADQRATRCQNNDRLPGVRRTGISHERVCLQRCCSPVTDAFVYREIHDHRPFVALSVVFHTPCQGPGDRHQRVDRRRSGDQRAHSRKMLFTFAVSIAIVADEPRIVSDRSYFSFGRKSGYGPRCIDCRRIA